jgi:pimeloyl-ACP methyl ester carboxylesterase
MASSCKRLGEKGIPLTVLHGTADKSIPIKCGEQVIGWHAEGARLRGGTAGLSNFYPVEGDGHGLVTATQQVRDIVAAHLRV